ncbi:MAG: alcohol dehydrogenase catalytic domain-containing protein [Methanothrix sp.]|nr:alcohol dehydrogenase catalytic domain-containing protein [Methanothrix sp.]
MRAAVLKAPGLLELDDLPDPTVPKGGALLEVNACAVCGTDVKMKEQGHRNLAYPRILGHEIMGRIAMLDGQIPYLNEGDLVQIWPGIACGRCRFCLRGKDSHCESLKIMGFNCDGGLAELMALPAENLSGGMNLLPRNIDPALAALSEPLACCLNGQEQAPVYRGDIVLILGGGPIGALHALLAELHGAENVIIAETLPERIRLLKRHTSAVVIDPSEEKIKAVLASETDERGADVILTATPKIPIDNDLLHLLSPGGRICVFSGPAFGHYEEKIDVRHIHYKEITINGAYGCTSRQNRSAVGLLTSGLIKPDWLITMRTSLEGFDEAFTHSAQRQGMRSVICQS